MHLRQIVPIVLLLVACATVSFAADQPSGAVNVNTATAEQLQLLPRVGPALAGRIVAFREANGPFESVDELVAVKGIGERSLERMKPFLSVEGDTTLAEKVRLPRAQKGGADS